MNKKVIPEIFFHYLPHFISAVIHPLLMPTLGIYIILTSTGTNASLLDYQDKNFILALVAAFTFIIPLAFVPFYYYMKITTSITLTERQDRIIPLLITASLYYLCYNLFRIKEAPHFILAFLLSGAICVALTLLITLWWKISAHMIGIGGITGLIFSLLFLYHIDAMFYLMIGILFSGLAAFARLSLNAHSPKQVYLGFFAGFSTTFLILLFY